MDKKNTTIGILLVIAAFACYFIGARNAPPPSAPAAVRQAVQEQQAQAPASSQPATQSTGSAAQERIFASTAADHEGSSIVRLSNSFIEVRFTDFGGAIRDVALKKYPAAINRPDPLVFNELHADPMLAFENDPGLDRGTRYDVVSQSATKVVFQAIVDNRLKVTRTYTLSPDAVGATDPYEVRQEITFTNLTDKVVDPMEVSLALGTAAPVNAADYGRFLAAGYSDGRKPSFVVRASLQQSGGFLGMNAHPAYPSIAGAGPIAWASVSNQFFVAILTPDQPGAGITVRRVKLLDKLPDEDANAYGVSTTATFKIPALAARGSSILGASFYVGPKEYRRLSNTDIFKADQDKVMQYGGWFTSFFAEILITLMTWIHSMVPGWGWGAAIVCTTLFLKTLFIPFTLAAFRSSRRMQKIQPEMKAINEKYKDNPQKKQQATLELFKQHKVNPAGSCIPLVITMPFFFGFYSMLQSTAELRFAPFLWSNDLSAPDTVGHLWGISINILPLILGATSFAQMHFTPQPTVDKSQQMMMKFTPLIFMMICYNYACSLSLYSTTNGLFTIAQQLIINRTKDPADAPPPAKSVSPRKKR